MSTLSTLPLPVHRIEDLKAGTVIPFKIESSSGVPFKAPSGPDIRRMESSSELDFSHEADSSATSFCRELPALISLLYPAGDTDSNHSSLFHLELKDSIELPITPPADDFREGFPRDSLTCLCEIIDPEARPGFSGAGSRQAVVKIGNGEAIQKEHKIYAQLQDMQGTFMPILLGRIRVPNSGTEALLLEYVERVPISSILKTPRQLIDLVESSFVFFERLIELNIVHDNWDPLENIAITAEGQLVFFGFGQCRNIEPLDPGPDIFYVISQLSQPLDFDTDEVDAWQRMMENRATTVYLRCLEKKLYTACLSDEDKTYLMEKTLRYRILELSKQF